MQAGTFIQDWLRASVHAGMLAILIGIGYGFYDLLLVLWLQPQGMEELDFLGAYVGLTVFAVTVGWFAVLGGLVFCVSFFSCRLYWLYGLAFGIAAYLVFARFNGMGLQQTVVPLSGLSSKALLQGLLHGGVILGLGSGGYLIYLMLLERGLLLRLVMALLTSIPWVLGIGIYSYWHLVSVGGQPMSTGLMVVGVALLVAFVLAAIRNATVMVCLCVILSMGTVGLVSAPTFQPADRAPSKGALSNLPDGTPKHILFVVSDTLRRDALSCYNPDTLATPNIDGLAQDSVLFKFAYAPAPWTTPSMVSMMTGLWPVEHGVMDQGPLADEVETLAEQLSKTHHTGAIGLNPMLRPEMAGLDQGFAEIDWQPRAERRKSYLGSRLIARFFPGRWPYTVDTTQLTDQAIAWYSKMDPADASFLWLHYFDPHDDYVPPEGYMPEGKAPEGIPGHHFRGALQGIRTGHRAKDPESRDWFHKLYLGEVQYVDHEVGRLMEYLKAQGLYKDMLIVFVSDHGEEFWEHNNYGHGHNLYGESIDVPLMIKVPGYADAGRVVEHRVSTVAVGPTLIALTGQGDEERNLLNVNGDQTVYASASLYYEPQLCVIQDGWKLIRWVSSDREALYHLDADPGELNDLAATHPERVTVLSRLLDAYHEAAIDTAEAQGAELDPSIKEQLQGLGYLE